MKNICTTILGVALCSLIFKHSFGQTSTQTIRGIVIDKESKVPLTGANISVTDEEQLLGSISDADGKFRIENIPLGRHDIKATYLGYEDVIIPEIAVGSGKEVVLTIEMTESVTKINEVVVSGARSRSGESINSMAVVSARSFSVEQTTRYAASLNDPTRLALSFAGVKGQTDILNSLIVRGNNPRGVLWKVEGIETTDPNHFTIVGYGGGAVSILSSNVLSSSDFYTGAFPAEYGNASSAAFDIKMRAGNNEKREYAIQVGMMGLEAGLEGPFSRKKRSSYLVNYRYSTLSLAEKIGFNTGNAITQYQDVNLKLNFPTAKSGTFTIFGIGGLSHLTTEEDDYEGNKYYDMGLIGVSHGYSINKRNHLKTILSLSANKESFIDYDLYPYITLLGDDLSATNINPRAAIQINTKFNARSSLRSGVIASSLNFSMDDNWERFFDGNHLVSEGHTYSLQGYSQWKYRFTESLSLLTGLHLFYFGFNQSYSVEPRFGLNWQIDALQSLNLGVGLHSRLEPMGYYMVKDPNTGKMPNANMDLTKAMHVVLAYTVYLREHLKLKAESYFQTLYDVPIADNMYWSFTILNHDYRYTLEPLVNQGLGLNYGIELTLEKTFANNYYFLINQTLFDSKYKAGDDIWRPTRYASNYITSVTGGKEFVFGKTERQHVVGLNLRLLWSGGERTEYSLFEEKISDYFRIDTRFSYTRNKKNYSWQISLDIQNLTNRLNENLNRDIDPIGIIPVLNFKVTF